MRDGFIFYRSFYEASKPLNNDDKLALYEAIFEFALNQNETKREPMVNAMFMLIKPQLEANNKRYENGKNGGRPPKRKTETKPKHNQNITETKPKEKEKEKEKEKDKGKEQVKEKEEDYAPKGLLHFSVDVILYLNQKANTNFRTGIKKTNSFIEARKKEGFTLEDFKTVIDKKTAQWKNDKKMCAYLRPETLFGTKFESYLNENVKSSVNCWADDEVIDASF